jgi:hypothetical protein
MTTQARDGVGAPAAVDPAVEDYHVGHQQVDHETQVRVEVTDVLECPVNVFVPRFPCRPAGGGGAGENVLKNALSAAILRPLAVLVGDVNAFCRGRVGAQLSDGLAIGGSKALCIMRIIVVEGICKTGSRLGEVSGIEAVHVNSPSLPE